MRTQTLWCVSDLSIIPIVGKGKKHFGKFEADTLRRIGLVDSEGLKTDAALFLSCQSREGFRDKCGLLLLTENPPVVITEGEVYDKDSTGGKLVVSASFPKFNVVIDMTCVEPNKSTVTRYRGPIDYGFKGMHQGRLWFADDRALGAKERV